MQLPAQAARVHFVRAVLFFEQSNICSEFLHADPGIGLINPCGNLRGYLKRFLFTQHTLLIGIFPSFGD